MLRIVTRSLKIEWEFLISQALYALRKKHKEWNVCIKFQASSSKFRVTQDEKMCKNTKRMITEKNWKLSILTTCSLHCHFNANTFDNINFYMTCNLSFQWEEMKRKRTITFAALSELFKTLCILMGVKIFLHKRCWKNFSLLFVGVTFFSCIKFYEGNNFYANVLRRNKSSHLKIG